MTICGGIDACIRCGSTKDIELVRYLRAERAMRELWCGQCRRQKLVRLDGKRPRRSTRPHVKPVVLLILVIVGLVVASVIPHLSALTPG